MEKIYILDTNVLIQAPYPWVYRSLGKALCDCCQTCWYDFGKIWIFQT